MKNHADILLDFSKTYSAEYDRRAQVISDIKFAFIPGEQWQGSDNEQWANKPKPENNKLFKNIMGLVGRYQEAEFGARIAAASDEATDKDAELLQSRWRNDFNSSDGSDACNVAFEEAAFGGFGAIKACAKYEDEEDPQEDYQYLTFESIPSAASSVFYNVGAMRKDKQDAKQCWQVMRVNREEMEEKYGQTFTPFTGGKISVLYDLDCGNLDGSKDTYVAHYYECVEKVIVEYNLDDGGQMRREGRKYFGPDGDRVDKEDFDMLLELYAYTEKRRTVKAVEYALVTGDGYLEKPRLTPFKSIPIIPMYGYHIVINGIEYYCGEVCRQKDNQRFLNMGFGALMEIVAEPQTTKPEYAPEQIQRHAQSRAEQTVKNFPFLMADPIRDGNNNPIHFGPTALHQPPQIGTGLASALQFLNQNIAEQSGNGQATLPSNTSAAAVQQVNDRTDDAFLPLFTNATATIRCLCKVWIPAAQKLYFTNSRKIRIQLEDGTYKSEMTLQEEYRPDVGYGPYKNSARGRYDVSVKQGESYRTKKESERMAALEMLQYTPAETPLGQMMAMTAIQSTTGEGMADVRAMARRMQIQAIVQSSLPLIMAGYPLDKLGLVDEEEVAIAQVTMQQIMQAQQQPNPQAMLAQAESQARVMEGQAAIQNELNDRFEAETKRMKVIIDGNKAGVDMQKTAAETEGQQLKNASEFGNLISGNFQGR